LFHNVFSQKYSLSSCEIRWVSKKILIRDSEPNRESGSRERRKRRERKNERKKEGSQRGGEKRKKQESRGK